MKRTWQIVANVCLYGFLLWLLVDATVVAWDPWFAFVVAFVLVLATIISLIPGLRAPRVSPGEYPFDD